MADTFEPLQKKKYTDQQRAQMAKEGKAKPDGSYPIADRADVDNAVQAWGRGGATESDKKWITRRAKALKATDLLPADWPGSTKQTEKAAQVSEFHFYAPLAKVSKEQDGSLTIEGYATAENPDDQPSIFKGVRCKGDIIDANGMEKALADYLEWGNLREMHQLSAVGTVPEAQVLRGEVTLDDGAVLKNPTWIKARVVDEAAKTKVLEQVYKGFSIGGPPPNEAVLEKVGSDFYRRVTDFAITEISLVDRPANPISKITVIQKVKGGETMLKLDKSEFKKGMDAMLSTMEQLRTVIYDLQYLRSCYEMCGDMDDAEIVTNMLKMALALSAEYTEGAKASEEAEGEPENAVAETMSSIEAVLKVLPAPALAKAGKTWSKANSEAMHTFLKGILKTMAEGGDDMAAQVMKAYGGDETETKTEAKTAKDKKEDVPAKETAKETAKVAGLDEAAIMKIVQPLLDAQKEQIAALQTRNDELSAELQKIKREPQPGGPVLRAPPAKQEEPPGEQIKKAAQVTELKRLVATEPNFALREGYRQQLKEMQA